MGFIELIGYEKKKTSCPLPLVFTQDETLNNISNNYHHTCVMILIFCLVSSSSSVKLLIVHNCVQHISSFVSLFDIKSVMTACWIICTFKLGNHKGNRKGAKKFMVQMTPKKSFRKTVLNSKWFHRLCTSTPII